MPGGHVWLVLKVCTAITQCIVTLIFNILQPYLCHFYCSRFNDTGLVIPKIPTVSPSTWKFWTSNFFPSSHYFPSSWFRISRFFASWGLANLLLWNFYQVSFLEFDVNIFKEILSIQRFFNLTEYREVMVKYSLLITYAEMQNWILMLVVASTNGSTFEY